MDSAFRRKRVEDWLDAIEDGDAIAVIWVANDVRCRAEEMGYDITDEQCRDILQHIYRRHEADVGINWDVIDEFVIDAMVVDTRIAL